MGEKGIQWVILVTDRYKESVNFYKEFLGFTQEREIPEEEFCQFSLKNCSFAVYGRNQAEKLLGKEYITQAGGAIYTLPETQNIDKEYQNLKQKGVRFIKEPATQPWGQRTAYFTDPDGHIWEIQQWLSRK